MNEVKTSFLQIAFVTVASMTVPYAGSAILIATCIWSLFGIDRALKGLTLVVLIKTVNPALVPELANQVNALGWLALGVAGTRILTTTIGRGQRPGRLEFWLLVFVVIGAYVSLVKSEFIVVSLFKLLSFAFTALAVFSGYSFLFRRGLSLAPWFIGLWLAVLGLSLPLLFVPTIAYFRDGMGFQGVLNQPQAMAIFCVPAAAWGTSKVFLHGHKAGWVPWVVFILSWVTLFLTRGRVGIVSIGISGVLAFLITLVRKGHWRSFIGQAFLSRRNLLLLLLIMASFAVFQTELMLKVNEFVHKGHTERTLRDSFEMSRGSLIAESMKNFKENVWTGIGFGISRSARFPFKPVIEPTTGLPISASTEKANLFAALLEEVGLIGTAAFLPLFFVMIRQAQNASFDSTWMILAILAINLGEMIFFSMGGLGLYSILLIGMAVFTRSGFRTVNDMG